VRKVSVAGIHQAVVNPLGTNAEYSGGGVSRSQNPAVVSHERKQSVVPINEDIQGQSSAGMDSKEVLRVRNTRFEFSVHEGTEKIMVKVIDEGTDEIIREIPPEQILNMVAKMWELAGLLVDKRA
jgi:uncharacterized FlaG/YvyC family protein